MIELQAAGIAFCFVGVVATLGFGILLVGWYVRVIDHYCDARLKVLEERVFPKRESHDYDEFDEFLPCSYCGVALTLVRPGKHQCDNVNCVSNFEPGVPDGR